MVKCGVMAVLITYCYTMLTLIHKIDTLVILYYAAKIKSAYFYKSLNRLT